MFMGYFVILTEEAPQIASGKEYGARAGGSCDAGLFPHMQVGLGGFQFRSHLTESGSAACPVGMTSAGAESAV